MAFSRRSRGRQPDAVVVGADIGDEFAARRAVGDVGDRNAGGIDLLDRRNHRLVVDRNEDDRVRLLDDDVFDLAQLLGNAVRLGRDILNDLDAERLGRRFGADPHRLEVRVGLILGEHRDGLAGGERRAGDERRQHGGYADCQILHLIQLLFVFVVRELWVFDSYSPMLARAGVDPNRQQNDDAGDKRLPRRIDLQKIHAVEHEREDERADQRARHGAGAAEQRRSADQNRGDGGQRQVLADVALRRIDARENDQRGEPRHRAAHGVDQHEAPLDRHAGQPRGDRIGADGVDLLAPDGALREQPADQQEQHHHVDRHRHAEQIAAAELAEAEREAVNGLAGHVVISDAGEHPHHAVGGDERRDAQRRHQNAVGEPDQRAAADAGGDAEQRRAGELDHARGQARRQRDVGADRQVEAGGEDDQSEARRPSGTAAPSAAAR